jgi:hypothetical protein
LGGLENGGTCLLVKQLCFFTGVSAAFAVKLFKSWINEKDINAVAASLRKVSMDNRLMVRSFPSIPSNSFSDVTTRPCFLV